MKGLSYVLLSLAILLAACGSADNKRPAPVPASAPPVSANRPEPANENIRFFEARIATDSDDFIAHNKLAGEYLQQLRETGDEVYLSLAMTAAKASLAILPAEMNKGGLAVLTRAEFSSHEFASARDHARRLTEIDPGQSYPYQLLGDALFELGEYSEAEAAYDRMIALSSVSGMGRVVVEQRLSKMAELHGNERKARAHMANALRFAETAPNPSAETIAWCKWQLGEMAMAEGDFRRAERYVKAALETFPGYFAAIEALGHLSAARGDLADAIAHYEESAEGSPDPATVSMLGDLYQIMGRTGDAERQYTRFEELIRAAGGSENLHRREIAMFYANHDLNTARACEMAAEEYESRRDIYAADLFAWACHKAGRLEEAQRAMGEAMRFGTKDAQLFYHAGMIQKELGNRDYAMRLLSSALRQNPAFDILQSYRARQVLRELRTGN